MAADGGVHRERGVAQVPPGGRQVGAAAPPAPPVRRRAPGARRRSWPPPAARRCLGRGGARSPGATVPPTPARSATWWRSAFTRVPRGWPGAGCTTRPAGLSTTSSASSSWTTARGMSSGRRSTGSGGGISTSTRWPAATRADFLAGRPSTSTSPRSASRAACVRDRSRRRASHASRRSGAILPDGERLAPPGTLPDRQRLARPAGPAHNVPRSVGPPRTSRLFRTRSRGGPVRASTPPGTHDAPAGEAHRRKCAENRGAIRRPATRPRAPARSRRQCRRTPLPCGGCTPPAPRPRPPRCPPRGSHPR